MVIASPDIQTYSLVEQRRPEIKNLATSIKKIGNRIIKDNNLETNPESPNLAWVINGDNSPPGDNSFSALQLKKATETGAFEGRGLTVSFRTIEKEPSLRKKYELDVAHGLTKEFLQRLGATIPTNSEGWKKVYDKETNVVTLSDPKKPFYAECAVNGTASSGEPNLVGFTIIPKNIELLAAA